MPSRASFVGGMGQWGCCNKDLGTRAALLLPNSAVAWPHVNVQSADTHWAWHKWPRQGSNAAVLQLSAACLSRQGSTAAALQLSSSCAVVM